MNGSSTVRPSHADPGTADWLRDALQEGALSRADVARRLGELDGWRNRKSELCAAYARKDPPRLVADLGLPLTPAGRGFRAVRMQCSL